MLNLFSKSDLFNTFIIFLSEVFFNISRILSSSKSFSLELSNKEIIISASFIASKDFSIPIFSISSLASLIPAVSTILIKWVPIFTLSSIVSLVVPAILEIIALS